jgi:acetyltransferase-like isoleucine patch superfamily enzyme
MKQSNIHPTAKIGKNVTIECDNFTLGANSIIKDNCKITCTSFEAGEGLYMCEGVEIGRGGCYGPNSKVTIGNNVGIFEKAIINPSEAVTIGDNVGIGAEVMIWTHGAWLDLMQGFPADFGPVTIEENVWLPARCIVLANVSIGKNTVIGIGSTVNKNIPEGSLAAGSPCKVIKENYYPKNLSLDRKESLVAGILEDWKKLIKFKVGDKYDYFVSYDKDKTCIELQQVFENNGTNSTYFNVTDKIVEGHTNELAEDLRDYLRRRGIKIYTENNFKSI